MPVHQVGLPADMDPLTEIAERHGVAILEDAACAIGASYKGRPVGSLSPVACFSLHPRKVITTGEGGIITVLDKHLGERLRQLRQHAMSVSDLARHNTKRVVIESYPERGFNYRMTDMQAALGLCQLEILDEVLERRRVLAERYTAAIDSIMSLEAPYEPPYATRTWQSYCVRIGPGCRLTQGQLMQALLDDGIPTRKGVMAIHEEGAYCAEPVELPNTEAATRDVVMLPLFPGLTFEQQDYVIERLAAHVVAQAA
jgi:dTDP-4-amino-4,6-dideoxygalactose transaminase